MDWEDAVEQCERILEMLDDLPDEAEEFASSVGEKVESIMEYAKSRQRITEGQQTALDNMEAGCQRWLENRE